MELYGAMFSCDASSMRHRGTEAQTQHVVATVQLLCSSHPDQRFTDTTSFAMSLPPALHHFPRTCHPNHGLITVPQNVFRCECALILLDLLELLELERGVSYKV